MADIPASGSGDSEEVFKWTEENTRNMLTWRTANSCLFTGKRNAALRGFQTYILEAGLRGKVSAVTMKRKWENFVAKYKNLKSPRSGVSTEGGEATAASWKWYGLMDEAMGARHVITPPVLISSSSPCPPPAVASPPLEVTPPGSNERPGRGEKRQREIEEIWCRMQREKEEEEKEERERERLERQREEEKEARYREEWRAERERERMEHLEERARWEREKAQMLEQWQEERQQAREREDKLMELLQMALRK